MSDNFEKFCAIFEENLIDYVEFNYPNLSPRNKFYQVDPSLSNLYSVVLSELPKEFSAVLKVLDGDYSNIKKFIYLTSALKVCKNHTAWIHWNVIQILKNLHHEYELLNCPLLIFIHSAVLLSISENDRNVEGLPRSELSIFLKELFPRDSIYSGLIATKLGNKSLYSGIVNTSNLLGANVHDDHFFEVQKLIDVAKSLDFHKFNIHTIKSDLLNSTEVLPKEVRYLAAPKGALNHYLFHVDSNREFNVPSIKIFDIPNGVFSIDISLQGRTHFYFFNEDGTLISDLSSGLDPFIEPDFISIEGQVSILDDQFSGAMNICHFIFDHLTRIYLYKKYAENTKFLITENFQYYIDSLSKYVDTERLIFSDRKRISIKASNLLVSSNTLNDFKHPAHYGNLELLNFIRNSSLVESSLQNIKVYISRADANSRRITNENDLVPELIARGYTVIRLSKLSFSEQVAIFSRATHVIGQHGAGLTNVIYCPLSCKVVEIFNPYYGTWSFWHIFNQMNFDYFSYIGKDPSLPFPDHNVTKHDASHGQRNIFIDIPSFLSFLDQNNF